MTDAATVFLPESVQHVEFWAKSLTQVLGEISGSPVPCAVLNEAPAELASACADDLWIVCACSGGLRGEMGLRLTPASIMWLAQRFTNEPPTPEAELAPEHREAVAELLRQVAGQVAAALKADWGDVQLRLAPCSGVPSWSASSMLWLRLGEDPALAALVEVRLSVALVAALREKTATEVSSGSVVARVRTDSLGSVNLDLLMDVDLAVTLRFGSRRLQLREILDLNPGSVIGLDRQVEEPVDVLLDGRLVARGEVVVMEGNYGLRVTEVAPGSG